MDRLARIGALATLAAAFSPLFLFPRAGFGQTRVRFDEDYARQAILPSQQTHQAAVGPAVHKLAAQRQQLADRPMQRNLRVAILPEDAILVSFGHVEVEL